MIPLTLKEIAAACGGTLSSDPERVATAVVIDSRRVRDGALFVALAGEHADGHDFAADAFDRGAAAAIVERDVRGGAWIRVDEALRALGAIAQTVRGRLTARTVAITGSSGKTCTKDMTAAAIATRHRVVASPASYNNEIGVPLTVLGADAETEVLIVEVGSRGRGHIAALMPIVQPAVAVVTNIGPAHLGLFGSVEETAEAKAELVEAVGPDGTAVLNADDPFVAAMARRARGRVVTFGRTAAADVRAEAVALGPDGCAAFRLVVDGEGHDVALRMPGEHMVPNALAAVAAARALGIPVGDAVRGIASCDVPSMRMQITDVDGRRIINDAYNANPDSMAAALETLVAVAAGRPTWAVLGHMAELGAAAEEAHDRIGRLAVRLRVGNLIVIGDEARPIHEAARREGMTGEGSHHVTDVAAAVALINDRVERDAVVLIKASRAAGLERVAAALGAAA